MTVQRRGGGPSIGGGPARSARKGARALAVVLATAFACAGAALAAGGVVAGRADAQVGSGEAPRAKVADLARELKAREAGRRHAAVRELAALDARAAWEHVLAALADPEPEVADGAQLALARVRDPEVLEGWLGRAGLGAREPAVRLRAAEALGRVGVELDVERLAGRVDTRDPEGARMLLWSIERLARAGRAGGDRAEAVRSVAKVARTQRDPELAGAALLALAALDHFASEPLVVDALAARDPVTRCAGVAAAGGWVERDLVEVARGALADPDARVRCQALENLERVGTKAAVMAIVEHLEVERRERLRWRMLGFLRGASGLEHGFEAGAWRAWAATIEGPCRTGERRGPVLGDTRVVFAGMPMVSDRVAFLIDFSGSMWGTKVGGRTRKEIVDGKVREALGALPEGTAFNLVPYESVPRPWREGLVPSSRGNVARAIEDFEKARWSGRGDFDAAARWALRDPEVDTVVVLTDGVPTGGERWDLELMFELLLEANRFRKVAFDAVLVDCPRGRVGRWERLAQGSGGRVTSVGLGEL